MWGWCEQCARWFYVGSENKGSEPALPEQVCPVCGAGPQRLRAEPAGC